MKTTGFVVSAICIGATALAACTSNRALEEFTHQSPTSICRYEVQSGVSGGEVVAALTPHDGYSCANRDGVSVFIATNADRCPVLRLKTISIMKIGLAEGTNILRSCNALSSLERPRSGDVLLVRVNSASRLDELESAALRGGYFVTYYLRESELHCFEIADAEKARAAGLARLAERYAIPQGLTWTKGTCRQAVGNIYGRSFPWRTEE